MIETVAIESIATILRMKDIKTMTAAELFPHDDLSTWGWLKHVKGYETDGGFRITVFAKGGPPT